MPITETPGIAGTVGGGGGQSNTMERFAEMMFRMREAKQQEAAQTLETSFKIFDATGIMPSEGDLKGPLKQLGVTLTPEMMQQFAERGKQQQASRQQAARLSAAQTRSAEASATGAEMDVQKQQRRQALGQQLSQAKTDDERNRILKQGLDQGIIDPKELTDDDKWQMTLSRVDPNKPSPEPGVSMRDYMDEAHGRLVAGLMAPDVVAEHKQARADQLERDKNQLQAERDRIDVERRNAKSNEDRVRIEQKDAILRQKEFDLNTKVQQAKMFAEKYNAISEYIKSDKQGSLEMFKAMVEAKKAGVPIPDSLKEQAVRGVARSMMTRGVMVD